MRLSAWRLATSSVATLGALLMLGGGALAQNTVGGDVFSPGEGDFVQTGSAVGSGPGFQFSDEFYFANGIDPVEMRNQEVGAVAPSRFGAFYRGPGDAGTARRPAESFRPAYRRKH